MLSLAELKGMKDLRILTEKTVDAYEERRKLIEDYRRLSKLLEGSKLALLRLKNELINEVIPTVKEEFLKNLIGDNKVTISAVEDVVKRHPDVMRLCKEISLMEVSVEEFRAGRDDIHVQLDMYDKAAAALESIGRNEGLRQKVKYGLSKIEIGGYLGEETAR